MKVLLLLFFLSIACSEDETTERLKRIVYKYEYEAKGNPELIKWIEDIKQTVDNGNPKTKNRVLRKFQEYDEKRLQLEELIAARIDEIESILPDRRLSQACVNFYEAKKNALYKANKLSIKEKQKTLHENSKKCTAEDITEDPSEDATNKNTNDNTNDATEDTTKSPKKNRIKNYIKKPSSTDTSSVSIITNTSIILNSSNGGMDKWKKFGSKFRSKWSGK